MCKLPEAAAAAASLVVVVGGKYIDKEQNCGTAMGEEFKMCIWRVMVSKIDAMTFVRERMGNPQESQYLKWLW